MPDYETKNFFAQNLARLLQHSGESQASLARLLGVSTSTVSSWICAEKMPRMDKIEAIARHFEVTKSELLEGSDAITTSDFTYALHNEVGTLTEENKQKILEMARFFNELQKKDADKT